MSEASTREKQRRRALRRLFDAGAPLACAKDALGRPGVRQLVVMTRGAEGAAIVHVEVYVGHDWDHSLEESDQTFSDFDAGLVWLEGQCAVHWSELRVPQRPEA